MEKKIENIIDFLTESDGGFAVGENNIKEAVSELNKLKTELSNYRRELLMDFSKFCSTDEFWEYDGENLANEEVDSYLESITNFKINL